MSETKLYKVQIRDASERNGRVLATQSVYATNPTSARKEAVREYAQQTDADAAYVTANLTGSSKIDDCYY